MPHATSSEQQAEISFDPNFGRRIIAYPHEEGASLGQGWDLVANQKKMAGCISFKSDTDNYQEATFQLQEAYDLESLDITLNFELSGNVDAGLLKGGGKTHLDAHYLNKSTDTAIVAHVSVVNGAEYVTPVDSSHKPANNQPKPKPATATPAFADLQLTQEAQKLAASDAERFREVCGDGFVASIVAGADIYVLFHFRELERDTKLQIELHTKAGAGIGSLLGGGHQQRPYKHT